MAGSVIRRRIVGHYRSEVVPQSHSSMEAAVKSVSSVMRSSTTLSNGCLCISEVVKAFILKYLSFRTTGRHSRSDSTRSPSSLHCGGLGDPDLVQHASVRRGVVRELLGRPPDQSRGRSPGSSRRSRPHL